MGPKEGHKDIKGLECLVYEERLRELGLFKLGEEKVHCGLSVLKGSL